VSSPAPIALVTGGSSGIGAATALRLAQAGYDVGLTYLGNRTGAERTARAITDAGRRSCIYRADSANEAEIVAAYEGLDKTLGRVSALVNNAGIVGRGSRVADITVEQLEHVLRVNVVGSFLAAREAVRRMSTRRGGHGGAIVNVSSAAARLGSPGEFVHYAASKGAVDTFTLGLAKEVADEGIRVNAVRPGMIETDIHAKSGMADRIDKIVPTVPMRRIGSADEVAGGR